MGYCTPQLYCCTPQLYRKLTGCAHSKWLCHDEFDDEFDFALFFKFSCNLQPKLCRPRVCCFLCMYIVCILLHNTYIHTYIPPLGGVCMYVCMYIVKNYILYNMYLCIYYNSVEFEKLMLKLSLKLSLKWNLLSLTSDLISWSAHWVLIELRFELKSLTFCKFWRSFDWNLEKSRKFPY